MNKKKAVGLAGAAAFVAVGTLGLGYGHESDSGTLVAGSGNAPANTTYVQPTEGAMNLGATATLTTPSSVEPIAKASPGSNGG